MPKTFPLYRSTTGLNVFVDPVRIKYDPNEGVTDLQACSNIELDGSGRISRRKGFSSPIVTGSMHSLFSCGEYALAVWNYVSSHYLVWLDGDGNSGSIVSLSNYNAKMCYAKVDDKVYYSNGTEKGYVKDKVNYSWTAGSVTVKNSTRTMSDPPAGHLMEVAFGRMWIAQGTVLYFSEPFAYNLFDMARCSIPQQGRISLLRAVHDGLLVSDNSSIYFFYGKNPNKMEVLKLAGYPAVEGGSVPELISGISLGLEDTYLYCVFLTAKGICAAGPNGRFFNLTEDKLYYPSVSTASAIQKGNGNFLFLLNS